MKRYLLWMLILFSLLLSCNKEIAVESVKFEKATVQLKKGEKEYLKVVILPENATDKAVTWSSSDASIASVDQKGNVSALKVGNATIMAEAGGLTATCQVTVTADVISISLSKTSLTLKKGDTETLTATVEPSDASDNTVTWSSSYNSVASVDKNGKVVALKCGNTTITAKAGGLTATCQVTVISDVTSIDLSETSLTLVEGESETLTATVKPDDAADKTVTWSSSNTSVATVEGGKVVAIAQGTATITAKAGDKTATCAVTVSKKVIAVTSVELNMTTLTLVEGESETLTATVKPDDATDKTVTWSSSNTSVATVEGGKVVAIAQGTATITAKAGDKTATCAVTVSKKVIAVTSVELNKTTLTLVEGESEKLTATVKPDDATDKTVTWSSSNTSVATVEGGKVVAIAQGTATITAKAGDKTAVCSVTVNKKVIAVTSVELSKTTLTLVEGESEKLTATVKPDDATDKTVTWTSSNTSVATVEGGKVVAIAQGTATITAKAGDKTATCYVVVKQKGTNLDDPEGFNNNEEEW